MKITLESLDFHSTEYSKVKTLYKKAFPRVERAPFCFLRAKAETGKAEFLIARDGEELVGMAYMVCHEDLAYLFYFAICEEHRGKGYGSAVLDALKDKYKAGRFFLALEQLDETAENYEQRLKRRAFYEHNGLQGLPVRIKEGVTIFDTMGVNGSVAAEEYEVLITNWCGRLISRIFDMRMLSKDNNS